MRSKKTTLSHDAFARTETVRETVWHSGVCNWCGGTGRLPGRLFRYGTEEDDRPGRVNWWRGVFCSVTCARDYNN